MAELRPARGAASRRLVLMGAGTLGGLAAAGAADAAPPRSQAIEADLARYAAFGDKASGGPGDNACGEWLIEELTGHGYACERQALDVPFFDLGRAEITARGTTAPVIPQAIVTPTKTPINGVLYLAEPPGRSRTPKARRQEPSITRSATSQMGYNLRALPRLLARQ